MDRNQSLSKPPHSANRPFPWRCPNCARDDVVMTTVEYPAEVRHDGRLNQFTIPELKIPCCRACGEKVFTGDVDQQINDALRPLLKLLTPANQALHSRTGVLQADPSLDTISRLWKEDKPA